MADGKRENVELVDSTGHLLPTADRRPRIPEPLPVRLVAVEDVRLSALMEAARDLDEFYVGLMGFEREHIQSENIYRAENLRLRISLTTTPPPRDLRPLGIEVVSLADVERRLIEREMEYEVQKSLLPGRRTLLLLDPGGNWVSISESPPLR
jgi:hypothetical protein